MRTWGNEHITTLATYYEENQYITNEEKQLTIQQWPLFRQIVLQRKHVKKDKEIHQENSDDIKGMALLLTAMMTLSGSTAACEQGFSCTNLQKKTFVRDLQKKHETTLCFYQLMVPVLTILIPLHI